MKLEITARHLTLSQNQKEYAEKKIQKLDKYFKQLIDAHIIMHKEKLDHYTEVLINGDGVQFHGREKSVDFYSSIDLLFEKMEKQINRYKEKHSGHKIDAQAVKPFMTYSEDETDDIILNQTSNKPTDKIEAYLEMRSDNLDYMLFKKGLSEVDSEKDYSNKNYAVIYRCDDESIHFVKIPFENIMNHDFTGDFIKKYEMKIISDSAVNPEVELKELSGNDIKKITIDEVVEFIKDSDRDFMPFFNVDTQYLNIAYKTGNEIAVMVPAF